MWFLIDGGEKNRSGDKNNSRSSMTEEFRKTAKGENFMSSFFGLYLNTKTEVLVVVEAGIEQREREIGKYPRFTSSIFLRARPDEWYSKSSHILQTNI